VLGFTLEELLPLKAPDEPAITRVPPRDRTQVAASMRYCMAPTWWSGATAPRTATTILSEAIATPVPLAERDVIMVQFRDIAREEQIRREMKRLESRLKEFMQDSDEGVAVLRADGGIDYLSDAGRKPAGVRPGSICLRISRNVPGGLARGTAGVAHAGAAGCDLLPLRYQIMRKDGVVRWHHAVCRYIEIENDLKGHLLHFRDITEQVEAEEARRRDQAALEYLARHNAMGEMATAIAHELATAGGDPQLPRRFGTAPEADRGTARTDRPDRLGAGECRTPGRSCCQHHQERARIRGQAGAERDAHRSQRGAGGGALVHRDEGRRGSRTEIAPCAEPVVVSCEKVLVGQVILNLAFNAIEEMATSRGRSGACASARPGRPGWRG
jgi:PAS domain-containing protein